MMVQEVEAASDRDGIENNILFCENDEERQQELATVDEILTEQGQGKVLSRYDKPCPTNQANYTIFLWRIFKTLLIGIAVVSLFAFGFFLFEFEDEKGVMGQGETGIQETLASIVPEESNEDDDFDNLLPPFTKGTPGVKQQYITKFGLIKRGYALQGGSEFDDPESYQSHALKVLIENGVLIYDPNDEQSGLEYQKLAQRYALLCLFYSTNGVRTDITDAEFGYGTTPSWNNTDGQSTWQFQWEEDDCDWPGVVCAENKLVKRLELGSHLLTGYLPMELILLNEGPIQVLDFSNNRGLGQGGFPAVFSEFDSLDSIELRGTSFVGSVPNELCRRNSIESILVDCNDVECDCCDSCGGD